MPSPTPSHGADRCWNCDRPADAFTEVGLRVLSGRSARYRLCGTCYATAYRPLVRELDGVREERDQSGTWLVVEAVPGVSPGAG